MTNDKGEYLLQNLPPGRYNLQAELSGFATVMFKDVELLVGQNATMPFTLKLASVSETLTVIGETPLVDTTSSQVAGNVNRRQMEELPLQGRNWMELSKLVKGITANDVGNSIGTGAMDDLLQLNLDGQQITQKVAGSGFGQPRFSREAIAEFQIVTNMFDITQGRSAGIEVQAISKSGTNQIAGSVYGFFRSDTLQRARSVRSTPTATQGAAVLEPAGRRHARRPDRQGQDALLRLVRVRARAGHRVSRARRCCRDRAFSVPYKNGQKSLLARVDDQLSPKDRLSVRGSRWDLGQSVLRRPAARFRSDVVGSDQERDQRPRHLVAR